MKASYVEKSLRITCALCWPVIALCAAEGGSSGTAAVEPVNSLRIFVLQGQNAVNSIPNRAATMPVVEVRDENDQPVEGAEVVFQLPPMGPGGFFPGGQFVKKAVTNHQGQAGAEFQPNGSVGRFRIMVTATHGGRTGRAEIDQENSMRVQEPELRKRSWFGRWTILAMVAGGAAVAGVVATRGGGGSAPLPTVALTPGIPTFGGPR